MLSLCYHNVKSQTYKHTNILSHLYVINLMLGGHNVSANNEIKRVTIPLKADLKKKLDKIGEKQKRNLTSTLEFALEVYAALHAEDGTMRCSIDNILLGKLPVFQEELVVHTNNTNLETLPNPETPPMPTTGTGVVYEPLM